MTDPIRTVQSAWQRISENPPETTCEWCDEDLDDCTCDDGFDPDAGWDADRD
jgi:hypothetical protein